MLLIGSVARTVGLLTPLPIMAFALSGVSAGAPAWDVALAAMHAAPGVGWVALGYVLWSREPWRPVVIGTAADRTR